MEPLANKRNGLNPLTIFLNSSVLDAWLGSKHTSEGCFSRLTFNKKINEISGDMQVGR